VQEIKIVGAPQDAKIDNPPPLFFFGGNYVKEKYKPVAEIAGVVGKNVVAR